jgi:putative ABC transport system permease protein
MAAVVALAFSGLLILAQVGIFVGIGKGFTAQIDRARADIMVLGPGAKALFGGPSGLPRRMIPLVYSHPEVTQVAPLDGSGGRFQNILSPEQQAKEEARAKKAGKGPSGRGAGGGTARKSEFVNVTVIDAIPGYVTVPTDYTQSMIEALRRPYAVAIDETALKRLGVKKGDRALYNGKTITVAVVTHGYPNIIQPTLVMSRDTLRMLGEADTGQRVGPLMVEIKDPSRAEIVAAQLNKKADGKFRAWTRQELADANSGAMLDDQIIGIILGFSAFLGLLIGVIITWQTLRGAIMANIKEFASLRALGVSMGDLRNIVMELSFWVGIVGVLAAGLLTWLVSMIANANGVPMSFPPMLIVVVAFFLVVIAMVSGFLSLGILKNSQPADLLR